MNGWSQEGAFKSLVHEMDIKKANDHISWYDFIVFVR